MKVKPASLFAALVLTVSCSQNYVTQEEFEALKLKTERFKDKEEIVGLSNVFTDAAARSDKELFRDLWVEDGIWQIGPPINKTFKGRDEIADAFEHLLASWEFFVQLNSGYNVDLAKDGKRATANFYLNEVARNAEISNYNLANYQDELIKKKGRWYFKKRTYNVLYLDTTALKGQAFQRKK